MFTSNVILLSAGLQLAVASPLLEQPLLRGLERRAGGTCTGGQWSAPAIGGDASAGNAFCDSNWGTSYLPITNLTVWSSTYSINGIQSTYSDGSLGPLVGSNSGSSTQSIGVDYAQGESWTGWQMFYNPVNGNPNINGLFISNSNGQEIYNGLTPYEAYQYGFPETDDSVGAGILLGTTGTADTNINSLGALFLSSPISSIDITNFTFPNGPNGEQGIHVDTLSTNHYFNDLNSGTVNWNFMGSESVATTHTFMQSTANAYGMTETITLSLMLPTIGGFSSATGFTWTTTYTESTTTAIAQTVSLSWGESGTLQPQTGVDCAALAGNGQGTYDYSSTVTINLKNGDAFSFLENGELTINDVSQAIVQTSEDDTPSPNT